MLRRIPIGVSDFRLLREEGLEYVDKSLLIKSVLDKGSLVLLLPRPRRFGKTLNLSMLRCFFEKRAEDLSALFADLSIWNAGAEYRAHFQRYPVVFVTFKDVKAPTWEHAWGALKNKIGTLFDEHRHVLEGGHMSEREIANYHAILEGTADRALYESALRDLTRALSRHHGERVVMLIDEYDEPIHAAWVAGYSAEVIAFFRNFLNAGLKDNSHLFKAVLTGILRIAKESLFSGLNHLAVYTLLARDFSTCFGFTEPEVEALLERTGHRAHLEAARAWYNGYLFGGTVIYNPWSVLNFVDRGDGQPQGYWIGTSSNDLVREMLRRHAFALQAEMEALMEGGSTERAVDENVVLADLATHPEAVWSLLLFSGYLKAELAPGPPDESPVYRLSIPNREVRQVYTSTFRDWMREQLGGLESDVEQLKTALLSGDAEALQEQLGEFTVRVLSYHDTRLRPEQVYHAFVIGLLATLEPHYRVRSNRESGMGRPDVTIAPRAAGKPGVVLELKVAKPGKKTPAQALREGLAQVRANDYGAELRAAGAEPVHALVVAFDGKQVWVRSGAAKARPAKKATAKKPTAKKATAKKPAVKKATAKKPAVKKPAVKKPAAKKATAKGKAASRARTAARR